MNIKELADRFDGVKWNGENKLQCRCPAHADDTASLSISEKDGKLLLHCHAGCDTFDILAAVGLTFKDIGNGFLPDRKKFEWKERMAYGVSKQIGAECHFSDEYKYTDKHGNYLYSKVRFEGGGKKQIRYAIVDETLDSYVNVVPKDKVLYNLPALLKTARQGFPIYYVEGEKDVETLRKLGYTATTAGGANDWRKEYAESFTGTRLYILEDNDEAGQLLTQRILKDVKPFAFITKWTKTSQAEHGDVTDFLEEGNDFEAVKELIAQTQNYKYPTWVYTTENKWHEVKINIHPAYLAKDIAEQIPMILLRNPQDNKEALYLYDEGVYKEHNSNMLNSFISRYIPTAYQTVNVIDNTRKMLFSQVTRTAAFDDINSDDRYINFKNGLYNIKERRFERHTPDVLYTTQLNCIYDEKAAEMPYFEKYINDLCKTNGIVNESKKKVLQEWCGLLISNIPIYRIKKCLILYSALGNTGKSQLINLLVNILGAKNCCSVALQSLHERFSTSVLYGKRLNAVGDQQYTEIETSSVFKQLTGGDSIFCEPKNKQAYSFIFRGGLIFACNDLPSFSDDKGGHVFERMTIVPCNNSVAQNERISNLSDLMYNERQAVVNWALEGLHRLMENSYHFTECDEINSVTEEYRENVDSVRRFVNIKYIITGDESDRIKKAELENEYFRWCADENVHAVAKRNIKMRFKKNGIEIIKSHGEWYYTGITSLEKGII